MNGLWLPICIFLFIGRVLSAYDIARLECIRLHQNVVRLATLWFTDPRSHCVVRSSILSLWRPIGVCKLLIVAIKIILSLLFLTNFLEPDIFDWLLLLQFLLQMHSAALVLLLLHVSAPTARLKLLR